MKIELLIEKILFPTNVAIIGGILLILYKINSTFALNDIIIFLSSIILYGLLRIFTKTKIKSETKKYSIPSLIAMLCFVIMSVLLPASKEFLLGALALLFIVIIAHIIRDLWKLSGHAMTYTSFSVILTLIDLRFVFLFILLPVVVWSRLKLKRHTKDQVLVATLVGFIIPSLIFLLFL